MSWFNGEWIASLLGMTRVTRVTTVAWVTWVAQEPAQGLKPQASDLTLHKIGHLRSARSPGSPDP
jgi:hypothetical protein